MPTVSLTRIKATWVRFCQLKDERNALIAEFRKQQPAICDYVTTQDKEWFPDGRPEIRNLAFFVWLVFISEHQGRVPTVSDGQLPKS